MPQGHLDTFQWAPDISAGLPFLVIALKIPKKPLLVGDLPLFSPIYLIILQYFPIYHDWLVVQ